MFTRCCQRLNWRLRYCRRGTKFKLPSRISESGRIDFISTICITAISALILILVAYTVDVSFGETVKFQAQVISKQFVPAHNTTEVSLLSDGKTLTTHTVHVPDRWTISFVTDGREFSKDVYEGTFNQAKINDWALLKERRGRFFGTTCCTELLKLGITPMQEGK